MDEFEKNMQSKKWNLTLNNPKSCDLSHEKIAEILHLFKPTYFCMADEIATTGTYHTHVFLYSTSPIRFGTVKKRFPVAHIEKAVGTVKENRDYIAKEGKWADTAKAETKVEGTFFEFGTPPSESEEKSPKMYQILQSVKDGCSTAEIVEENPSFCLQTQKIDQLRDTIDGEAFRKRTREVAVHYLYGETGTGKTESIFQKHGLSEVYRITDYGGANGVRFDDYQAHKIVLFQNFEGQIPIDAMLNYLDIYPLMLPARFHNKVACYTTVYITSDIPLEEQYNFMKRYKPHKWKAFQNRINTVTKFSKDGSKKTMEVFYDNGRKVPDSAEDDSEGSLEETDCAANVLGEDCPADGLFDGGYFCSE